MYVFLQNETIGKFDRLGLLDVWDPSLFTFGITYCDPVGVSISGNIDATPVYNCAKGTIHQVYSYTEEVTVTLGGGFSGRGFSFNVGISTGHTRGEIASIDLPCCTGAFFRQSYKCTCNSLNPLLWGVSFYPPRILKGGLSCSITSSSWEDKDVKEHCPNCK